MYRYHLSMMIAPFPAISLTVTYLKMYFLKDGLSHGLNNSFLFPFSSVFCHRGGISQQPTLFNSHGHLGTLLFAVLFDAYTCPGVLINPSAADNNPHFTSKILETCTEFVFRPLGTPGLALKFFGTTLLLVFHSPILLLPNYLRTVNIHVVCLICFHPLWPSSFLQHYEN